MEVNEAEGEERQKGVFVPAVYSSESKLGMSTLPLAVRTALLPCKLNGIECRAMVDDGSMLNLVPRGMFERLRVGLRSDIRFRVSGIHDTGGVGLAGHFAADVEFGGLTTRHFFWVNNAMKEEKIYLGMPFVLANRVEFFWHGPNRIMRQQTMQGTSEYAMFPSDGPEVTRHSKSPGVQAERGRYASELANYEAELEYLGEASYVCETGSVGFHEMDYEGAVLDVISMEFEETEEDGEETPRARPEPERESSREEEDALWRAAEKLGAELMSQAEAQESDGKTIKRVQLEDMTTGDCQVLEFGTGTEEDTYEVAGAYKPVARKQRPVATTMPEESKPVLKEPKDMWKDLPDVSTKYKKLGDVPGGERLTKERQETLFHGDYEGF